MSQNHGWLPPLNLMPFRGDKMASASQMFSLDGRQEAQALNGRQLPVMSRHSASAPCFVCDVTIMATSRVAHCALECGPQRLFLCLRGRWCRCGCVRAGDRLLSPSGDWLGDRGGGGQLRLDEWMSKIARGWNAHAQPVRRHRGDGARLAPGRAGVPVPTCVDAFAPFPPSTSSFRLSSRRHPFIRSHPG